MAHTPLAGLALEKKICRIKRHKILKVCKTTLPRNRIISFPEESDQLKVLEMGKNLSGAVPS